MPRKHRPLRSREPKACAACARLKVRCEVPAGTEICTRCLRLNRECIMQAPGAHKRVDAMGRDSSDVARLEERLDSISAAFTAQTPLSIQTPLDERSRDSNSILANDLPANLEAQTLLTTFQTELSPYFPFIAIPMGTTASDLQVSNLFLFDAILMVSDVNNADRQLRMARRIREYIGTSVVANGKTGLNLLQGLLVCLAWYQFQLEMRSSFGGFLHVALGMLGALGLGRKQLTGQMSLVRLDDVRHDPARQIGERSLDERRVYLGCFYLSAVASVCAADIDPMRYTAYTKECCRVLESAGGSTDLYLVRLVRLHRMVERFDRMLSLDDYAAYEETSTPISTRIETFEAELQRKKQTQPPHNLHDSILQLHHFTLEIKLYSIALEDNFPQHEAHPSTRLTLLASCINETKAFLDLFSAIPTRNYLNLPYPVWSAYFYVLGTLSNLLLFAGEGWDREHVQSVLDLQDIIETSIAKIEDSSRNRHQHPYQFPEALVRLVPRLRSIVEAHKATLGTQMGTESNGHQREDSATDDARDIMFPLPHGFSWRFLQH
ncbi:hypothetical protein BJX66DRAFT_349254 [Aspergillus keveii]|uniref:Zn(2)-C6 fungal-type domain-containing protein n=1 Tax=Aspergillus keveii TaxID=714993 RepID=A0ABR4GEQ5_9EURO